MRAIFYIIFVCHYRAMCINVEDTKCQVYDELTFKHFPTPLVEFTAWISKGKSFRIVLKYKKEYNSIIVNSTEIALNVKDRDEEIPKIIPVSLSVGWLDFTLSMDVRLSLSDEHRRFFSVSFNKDVESITIENGRLILNCASHNPIWKVEGKSAIIPQITPRENILQELSFYSQSRFRPEIQLQEHTISLGTLEPYMLHLFNLSLDDLNGLIMELKQGNRRINRIILSDTMEYISVNGDPSDCFYVRQMVQMMPRGNQATTSKSKHSSDGEKQSHTISTLYWNQMMETEMDEINFDDPENTSGWLYGAISILSFLLIITFAILVYMIHRKMSQNQPLSRPTSEHTYEEIDEEAIAKSIQMKIKDRDASEKNTTIYMEPIKPQNPGLVHFQEKPKEGNNSTSEMITEDKIDTGNQQLPESSSKETTTRQGCSKTENK